MKHYALSITVTGSPGAAVDLWQSGFRFVPYVGEGYIAGDDIISGSDWTSTTDVISVGAWCANTTQRTNAQGQQDTQSPEETLGDIGSFSSYGQMFNGVTQPMVCAPGVNVVSAWNRYFDAANGGPTSYIDAMTWQGFPYGSTTGTSMACPAVAGIVARRSGQFVRQRRVHRQESYPLGLWQGQCQAGTGVHPGSCYGNR